MIARQHFVPKDLQGELSRDPFLGQGRSSFDFWRGKQHAKPVMYKGFANYAANLLLGGSSSAGKGIFDKS